MLGGDEQMNINRTTGITEGGELAYIYRHSARKNALAAGVLYLLTFVSVPIGFLYSSVLNDPNYIVGSGQDTAIIIGGILEIIVALAGIGTAVALYPVVKRQNESVALGLVGSRVLEASTIFADVVCLLAIVTLRRAGVGAEALVTGQVLVALYAKTATSDLVSAA
jgi:hypothetical protein